MSNPERSSIELGFEPVVRVDEEDRTPISGEAMFVGVPYTFYRIPLPPGLEDSPPPDACFELRPIDSERGPVMRALGRFRKSTHPRSQMSTRGGMEHLAVHWTELGPVGLDPGNLRLQFADFLDRLTNGTATAARWSAFAVNHYRDELVENIRRDCIHLLRGGGTSVRRTDS